MKKKTIFFMTFGSCEFCNKVINFLGPQNSSPYKKGQVLENGHHLTAHSL